MVIETRNAVALVDYNSNRNGFHPAHGSDDQADIPQEPEVRRTGLDHPPERRAASFGDSIRDLTVARFPYRAYCRKVADRLAAGPDYSSVTSRKKMYGRPAKPIKRESFRCIF